MPKFVIVPAVPQLSLARDRGGPWRRASRRPREKRGRGDAKPGSSLEANSIRWVKITKSAINLLIDRVERAIESGRLELVEHPADVPLAGGPAIHTEAYSTILAVLFEEEYEMNPRDVPTATPPRSAERVAVYAERVREGRPVDHPGDITTRNSMLTLAGGINSNGTGMTVTGWLDDAGSFEAEEAAERPPETLALTAAERVEVERRRGKRAE